jgi:hypothetical protein
MRRAETNPSKLTTPRPRPLPNPFPDSHVEEQQWRNAGRT